MIRKASILLLLIFSLTQAQTFEWVSTVPFDIQTNPSYLHSPVTVDNEDNPVYARLVYYRELYNMAYMGDIEIGRRDPSGILVNADTIYGKADVSEIVTDTEGNIICRGTFRDTIHIGSFQFIHTTSYVGNFIVKYNLTDGVVWAKGGTELNTDIFNMSGLCIDANSNIIIGITTLSGNTEIKKLNPSGDILANINQQDVFAISDITIDQFGNLWATGSTTNHSQSFNGLDTIAPYPYSEYVVKYDSGGTAQWVQFIEDVTFQPFQIVSDNAGNAYLSGNLLSSILFGNLQANGPQWVYDFFITKIDPDGNFIWLREIPPGNNSGDASAGNSNFISCSGGGDVYFSGVYRGEINFGNDVVLYPFDYYDAFIVNYNPDGDVQWVKRAGSSGFDKGSGVIVDAAGNCYVTGVVSAGSEFDTISVNGGFLNLYLAKIKNEDVVSTEENHVTVNNFSLQQNFPNPFNPSTKIKFSVPISPPYQGGEAKQGWFVQLKVYDILGNEIATLVNEELPTGNYDVDFNSDINYPASGIYFYQLRAGNFSQTKKMMLLK